MHLLRILEVLSLLVPTNVSTLKTRYSAKNALANGKCKHAFKDKHPSFYSPQSVVLPIQHCLAALNIRNKDQLLHKISSVYTFH